MTTSRIRRPAARRRSRVWRWLRCDPIGQGRVLGRALCNPSWSSGHAGVGEGGIRDRRTSLREFLNKKPLIPTCLEAT
jgi:hypothetical protein